MRRVLLYALIYGAIGASVGVVVALYTQELPVPKNIVIRNGSATKDASSPIASSPTEVAEPSPQQEN